MLMSSINWGEVFCVLRRHEPLEQVKSALAPLRRAIQVIPANAETAEHAAELKAAFKLGYADAFAAELALVTSSTLVTSDRVFKKLGKNINLRLLPSARTTT